ncbi:MAG: diguanylate cyclase [Lachnospiraceae bacterium]|nr:diguanylate cyclase [Lachnospiraceae bacterium]
MSEFYGSEQHKKAFTRDAIIGLGEDSFRKNYYPELQEKIIDLEQINARNKTLISTIPDILLVSNLDGTIVPFTLAFKKEAFLLNELLKNDKVMHLLKESVKKVINTTALLTEEFQMHHLDQLFYFEARFQQSETDEILIIIRNMTERITLEHQLLELVERDTLTKLYNRRNFEEKMNYYNGKEYHNIAIISIDMNGLKFINDTLGHQFGDLAIIAASEVIFKTFVPKGYVARIGGDEFGVIIEAIEDDLVDDLLNQLAHAVKLSNTVAQNSISLAYGYSHHKEGIVNMEFMFQEADNNMYQNKLLRKESTRSTFVKTFMKALEVKDFVSESHARRIEKLVVLIGKSLGLHQDKMDKLILLSKFHDIGKIGIPDVILKKPAPLTDLEWKVMKTHTSIGERIALEASEIKDIAHLILKHHEKWDGTGYPLGLCGAEIPIECRILAIVDSFDAMTNDRPYRSAFSAEKALREIESCCNTQFDPDLVNVFLEIMKNQL